MMDDDFDDFFDSPRRKTTQQKSVAVRKNSSESCRPSSDLEFPSTSAKPPAHPGSRPSSGLSRGSQLGDCDRSAADSRRVIEAKIPTGRTTDDDDDDDYSDEEFEEEENDELVFSSAPTPTSPRGREISNQSRDNERRTAHKKQNEADISPDEDSDGDNSDVTDVSPLSSPHVKPRPTQNRGLEKSSPATNKTYSKRTQSDDEEYDSPDTDRDAVDFENLLKTVLSIESRSESSCGSRRSIPVRPESSQRTGVSRRNYSFSNDQIRAIDRENQRLMQRIMKHAADAKIAKTRQLVKKSNAPASTTKRPTSASINRAKQLQKIEAENLMILSRLQHTRPSRNLQRDTLIGRDSVTRPISSTGQRTGSACQPDETRRRPNSSFSNGRRQSDNGSRPATAVACRPGDDDILTWDDG